MASVAEAASDERLPPRQTLGPIHLASGVSRRQVLAFATMTMFALSAGSLIPLLLPYVLVEQLDIPAENHGRIVGTSALIQSLATVVFITFFGALADRVGRRTLILIALPLISVAAFLYPLATSITALFAIAFLNGVGHTFQTAGAATSVIDYPAEESRAKFISLLLLLQGLTGALLVGQIGAQLPKWFVESGAAAQAAGRYAFWLATALGLFATLIAALGLRYDRRQNVSDAFRVSEELVSIRRNLRLVLQHARDNRRFRLLLVISCVVRSDFVVVGTYMALWIVTAARAQGIDAATATQRAGTLHALLMIASVIAPLALAYFVDRFERMRLVTYSLLFCALSFGATVLVDDVFGLVAALVVIAIGLAEGAMIVTTQSLLGQEAPPELRGSTMGVYVLLGVIGVSIVNVVGGFLFDIAGVVAPFLFVGLLNLLAFGLAVALRPADQRALSAPRT